ncbi:hypothetical protein ANN_16633 [Periplaneta americana]|uniref:Uncharacterized protein n=1 Tax=Periplaneta americana TaxID=6978 RepID=A0ABQ8SQY0_PERAM|nr:hypothetical protein ANN_16633 [Periplaneta americana]
MKTVKMKFPDRFGVEPSRKATMLRWEKRAFATGSVKDRYLNTTFPNRDDDKIDVDKDGDNNDSNKSDDNNADNDKSDDNDEDNNDDIKGDDDNNGDNTRKKSVVVSGLEGMNVLSASLARLGEESDAVWRGILMERLRQVVPRGTINPESSDQTPDIYHAGNSCCSHFMCFSIDTDLSVVALAAGSL